MAEDSDQGDKTEEPSAYRLEDFRSKGQVASSKEVNSLLILAATLFTLGLCGIYILETMQEFILWLLKLEPTKIYTDKAFAEVISKMIMTGIKCSGPVLASAFIIGFLTQLSQIGFIYAPDLLSIKFERIDPLSGFKRIFAMRAIVEVIKGLFKFAIIISITYFSMKSNFKILTGFLHLEVGESLVYGQSVAMKLAFSILLGLVFVATGDFAWEKYSYRKKLMMTKQEVKQEHKEKEGNPEIKQKIKNIQREMSRKRMMANVPKADFIVTNPTHLSVAIKYDPKNMLAPEVIAKGADHVALKIREIAKTNDIPIVENIPLARTLYKTVKVGEGVPRSLYKAVAEVLAFVYKKKRRRKALGAGV
ncbi:MAG: flagellar biosynthesis protein FlhB [Bacteriovoracaceae bacterium]|nr:flagellar biosynthesis protein FlhB [Bacteriovoracaceae bacterium]